MVKGKIPEGKLACHKCNNRKCCNPDHIYVGSALQNNTDKIPLHGRKTYRISLEVPQDLYIKYFKRCCELDIKAKDLLLTLLEKELS